VGVTRRETLRRWTLVGGGVAALCALPAAISAWPVPRAQANPRDLRDRMLDSAAQPYEGYVESTGRLGLPDLPALTDVTSLLGGSSRIRAWYASPDSWRVAQLYRTGERDIYRTPDGTYVWDFERDEVVHTPGELPLRLPWAADLTPPDLARRLLRGAAPGDALTALPAERVAGVVATGLRLTPTDPDTTVGRLDIWADPRTGLPLRVEVAGRGAGKPAMATRFLDLSQRTPAPGLLTPAIPDTASVVLAEPADVTAALRGILSGYLPPRLAGRSITTYGDTVGGLPGVAGYGDGFATFAVVALPGRLGGRTLAAARGAGATPVPLTGAEAYQMSSSLLTTLVVRTEGDRATRRGWLVAGMVSPALLQRVAVELVASR
jgi:hypothetical protein